MRRCENDVIEIEPRDKGFKFMVSMVEYPRAAISISNECPPDVRTQLQMYVGNGWIKPVAYVRESEYVWEKLSE